MAAVIFWIGAVVAVALMGVMLATLAYRPLRIWPTPGPGTWQSYVFWPLFRGLNILCFALALFDTTPWLGLPMWIRALGLAVLVASSAMFGYAFRMLGRDNSYGAVDGLVTGGIYGWSRNPQNAMLMVVYAALAIAADTARISALCAAMIAAYTLMVFAEEPWLREAYSETYRDYCKAVPRFFPWRRALAWARGG